MIAAVCHLQQANSILLYRLIMNKLLVVLFLLLAVGSTQAQDTTAKFSYTIEDISATEKMLIITAKPNKGVQLMSTKFINVDLPINTVISFDSIIKKYLKDTLQEIGVGKVMSLPDAPIYNFTVYGDSVVWKQKIAQLDKDTIRLKGTISYGYFDGDGVPKTLTEEISKQVFNTKETTKRTTSGKENAIKNYEYKSLWALFLAALGFGFIAFLTPCVYALVPVTVSMFLKKSKTPEKGRKNILIYAISIVAIYTLIGALTGVAFTQDQLYNLSTHWVFNLFIFTLFIIFGLSFLGFFEINLPNSWANAVDKKSNMNSYSGIFFMALTLVIVSFSCTSIFVANLLTTGAAIFGKTGPIVGMFAFGLGLAAPFMLLALKPKMLTVLTKSGGWQNALKVTLGFLELALALKFLSNADLDQRWRILDREVFLVLWIVIFLLLGIYLLGKIRFKLDSGLPKNDWGLEYIPVPRLLLAMTSLAFAIYLIPGLWGAPLKAVSSFVPPMGTQDFTSSSNSVTTHSSTSLTVNSNIVKPPKKYVEELKLYHPAAAIKNELAIYHDYDEAMAAAKALKKPLLIDFTGIQCVNCRKFEGSIWPNEAVAKSMKEDFVIASLFTDFKEELNDNEKKHSELLDFEMKTVGDKYKDLQLRLINTVAQPNYVFVDNNGQLLHNEGYGYEPSESASKFLAHLQLVKDEFKKRNQ
jgi:thiol:disulfide interchange protein